MGDCEIRKTEKIARNPINKLHQPRFFNRFKEKKNGFRWPIVVVPSVPIPAIPGCPLEMFPAALPQAVDLLHQSIHLRHAMGSMAWGRYLTDGLREYPQKMMIFIYIYI